VTAVGKEQAADVFAFGLGFATAICIVSTSGRAEPLIAKF
jgi:hypothetical protein